MPNPTLITGCCLAVPSENKAAWGDLWHMGSVFIFNAVCEGFDTGWMRGDEARLLAVPENKVIKLMDLAPYFDRRGVIVFEKLHATCNGKAREFLLSNPDFQR